MASSCAYTWGKRSCCFWLQTPLQTTNDRGLLGGYGSSFSRVSGAVLSGENEGVLQSARNKAGCEQRPPLPQEHQRPRQRP